MIHTALQGYTQRSLIDETDNRGFDERYAEATIGIHQFWLDHNTTVETSGGEKPHITVTVPWDVLAGNKRQLPEVDGYAIDTETLKRWACDAGIVRIITDPAPSQSTSEGVPAPSHRLCAEHSTCVTVDVSRNDATYPHRGATHTTSSTGPTEATPTPRTVSSCAQDTTP